MGKQTVQRTDIEWATHRWNPVTGCCGPQGTLEDPKPCWFCYGDTMARRFHGGDFTPRLHEERFPPQWPTKPSVVFGGSTTDFWSAGVPQDWRDRVFAEVLRAQVFGMPVDCVVLTKRPQEFTDADRRWFASLRHLLVGVSVTGPQDAWRYGELCKSVPAGRRVLSMEPLLSGDDWPTLEELLPAWAILGPRTPVRASEWLRDEAARELAAHFMEHGVPLFVKPSAAKAWPGVPLVQEWPAGMYYKPVPPAEGSE
jgi:protein gp37